MEYILIIGLVVIGIANYYTHRLAIHYFAYKFREKFVIDPQLVLFLQQKNAYLQSGEWAYKRNETKLRDDFTCQLCGAHYNLHVHHMSGYNLIPNEPYSCLITLCKECHTAHHEKYGYPQTYEEYMNWNQPIKP